MPRKISYKTQVGLLVLVGTILLVTALYFIGNTQHIFSRNMQIYAVFQNVNGLQVGNNVRYSGVVVGTVGGIEMVSQSRIVLELKVEEQIASYIRKDAVAAIGSDGLVGSMVVNILPGKENLAPIVDGDTIATFSKIAADDMLSTLNVTNENAALLTADLLRITQKILDGEGAIGALISDSTLTDEIRASVLNLRKTSDQSTRLFRNLNAKISKIDMEQSLAAKILTDTTLGDRLEQMVLNLELSSESIVATTEKLDQMMVRIDTTASGLNYLTQNEQFTKQLDATMIQIHEASKKLNQNMDALQHHFLFRGYFRKQERLEKKRQNSSN